jgi:beta-mannosidase
LPASPVAGDSHTWKVWHQFRPPSAYRDDLASFASEFGARAPPTAEALRRFIPPAELWPPGPSWSYHGAGLQKLRRYAKPFLTGEKITLDSFVQASQRAQAYGLQIAIEQFRQRRAHGRGGVLVWQLNEPLPAISWARLDHARQPKPAYHAVQRLFTPLLVSVGYRLRPYKPSDAFGADVWILNDRAEAIPGCHLELVL